MQDVNFQRTYRLEEVYEGAKERLTHLLGKYLGTEDVYRFNDADRSITFISERIFPSGGTSRRRVMLLFSNPHPHSIQQGMFLAPTSRGRESDFWSILEQAGWLPIGKEKRSPKYLAEMCLQAAYPGPFELAFYCYYAFPSNYPDELKKIFGREYFSSVIEPEARLEFTQTVKDMGVETVIAFNKEVYNRIVTNPVETCIQRLKAGELIHSLVKGVEREVPVFLTFPTGWLYDKAYRQLRIGSLQRIKDAI